MAKAKNVMIDCLGFVGKANDIVVGIEILDGVDQWDTYLKTSSEKLTAHEKASFVDDANRAVFGGKPGTRAKYKEIPHGWTIAIDNFGHPKKNSNGEYLYRNIQLGTEHSLDKIPYAKEKNLWFFTKEKEKMVAAPIWYQKVKKIMLDYPMHAESNRLLSLQGAEFLRKNMEKFFEKIEMGKGQKGWEKILYTAFLDGRGTHWYLMSKMLPGFFDILESRESIKQYMGIDVPIEKLPDFREAASTLASKAKTSPMTVLDVLGPEYRSEYGRDQPLIFKYENGKPIPTEDYVGKLTKEYLLGLDFGQQVAQVQRILGDKLSINKFMTYIKLKLWNHPGGHIFKIVSTIGNPSLLATLMSVSAGVKGFIPLLALNSGMVVGEYIAGKTLRGNRNKFVQSHGLGRGLQAIENHLSPTAGLGELARKYTTASLELFRQGLFNVAEPLMVGFYHQNQIARYFKEIFPGVKDWDEVDLLLSYAKETNPEKYRQIISGAHNYADHAMGKMFNQYARSAVNNDQPATYGVSRPYVETLLSMRHFFSSWGVNKIRGVYEILAAESNRIFNTKFGAQYLDFAFYSPEKIKTLRNLQQEEFNYFAYKLFRTLKIGKYIDRASETDGEKEQEGFFSDVADMFAFAGVINGDIAALDSTSYGRIIKHFFSMVGRSIEVDQEGDQGIDVKGALQAGGYAAGLEVMRSFLRKLYLPQMLTEVYSRVEDGQLEDKSLLSIFLEAFRNGSTGFLYMLDTNIKVAGYEKDIQPGPGSVMARGLGMVDPTKEYIMEMSKLTKLRNAHASEFTFDNLIKYNIPFLKQYYMSKKRPGEGLLPIIDKFNKTDAVKSIIDGRVPIDAYDSDYKNLYSSITSTVPNERGKIGENGLLDISFEKEGKTYISWQRQSLVDTLHLLKKMGVGQQEAKELLEEIENLDASENKKDAMVRALYVTDYIDSKSPGASALALGYIIKKKVFQKVYLSGVKYDPILDVDLKKQKTEEAIQSVMREYGDLALQVDKYFTQHQFYMHYAKTHNPELAEYISEAGENESKTLKFQDPKSGWSIKELNQHTEAFLYMAAAAKEGIEDVDLLVSEFSTLFDINKYKDEDGKLSAEHAAYFTNLFSNGVKFIDTLAVGDKEKHALKMSMLTLGDTMYPYILENKKLMERDDVKEVIQDWARIYFDELKEVDQLAEEMSEEEFEEKKYSKSKWYKGKGGSYYYNKFPRNLVKWQKYLKENYYKNYYKFKPLGWTKKEKYSRDYLRESEFLKAKRAIDLVGVHSIADAKSKAKASGGKNKNDSGILAVGRRGKSIANYVREDIDKPVEYKTPWRKRWVRKGKGVAPISTTTWKHLTPKPPKK